METAAKIYEEGKKTGKDAVQVNPAWVLEESLESLSSKFPILPHSQGLLTFCTTPLSSKLESKPEDALFDSSDKNVLRYNVLHDPHLKEYFQNPETRRRLLDHGFITEDGYVKCNLVEFNNYRKWIRKLKLEELYKQQGAEREEEISYRNHQLMLKKLEREKESLYIVRERQRRAKEYAKKRKEKRDIEKSKSLRLQQIDMRRREKMRKERRNQLDDVEEEREKRQVERGIKKIVQEDKKRRTRLRIVRKQKQEDIRRDAALNERRRLGRCQRKQERKNQWKRRCTIALGNITERWKEESRLFELRERNIERRAKMYQRRQTNNQESVRSFVKTRRATLQQEFLEAEEYFNKLRMKKDIEIANWKRKHERMLSKGSSIVKPKGSKMDSLDEYMALRRWSAPDETGFRRRLKSTWDLKSSLIRDLEEEPPTVPSREEVRAAPEKEQMKDSSKDVRVKVRSYIKNIISNAQNVFEEEKKRLAVKGLVSGIIDSAVTVVEKERQHQKNRTFVRRYVFSVIENASQTLEKERREALKAKMEEEEARKRVKEQMICIAAELVSAAMVFAKRRVEKDQREKTAEDGEELREKAKWIVGTAIERACSRLRGQTQAQDIRRVSSESLPASVRVESAEVDYDANLDWAVRNIVSDAVATAVDSMERLYYKESDLMEAATGLMNCAIINAQESLENLHRVTPALEEQINRMAWRLANRALISAENALEKQREESIKHAAEDLTSHAILSAQNSFARMEEQMLCETAEELALKAIMTAQRSLRTTEEVEFFSQELATRAILEAKESLIRADEIERTSRELARRAIELAHVSSQSFLQERADEAKNIAVAAAERCIDAYKSQENLPPESDLIATEALRLAIQAIDSAEGFLEEIQPRTTCILTDGRVLSGVMQYVEGIIVRALQELESNKDIDVLKPGNIRTDEYGILSQSGTSLHKKSFLKYDIPLPASGAGETSKLASSSRRRSSVHFNAMNIINNRKHSISGDADHIKVRNRPPTPRFLAQRSFTNQLECSSWETLEQKLKGIEKKDRVKVLLSTRKWSPAFADRRRLDLRRFSSDQGLAVQRKPVVSFEVSHAASDSHFRRPSGEQDSELVKEMLDSSKESEGDFLDAKEHRECEYDTLVSMTNTPEPLAAKDSADDALLKIRSGEERIPCLITPRTSSYILLPKLESNEKALLQAKVTELEQTHESTLTRLPAVSPTKSLVMAPDTESPVQTQSKTTTLTAEEQTNLLPKISKSGSLVSMDRELLAEDSDKERPRTVSEAKSEALTTSAKPSQAEVLLASTKPSSEVAPVHLSDAVMEALPKPSIDGKISPKPSSQSVKMGPTEGVEKVSPKPSRETVQVLPETASDSSTAMKFPSTEAAPAPSSEKLSPKLSRKEVTPTASSTETTKVSSKICIESPKASSEHIEKEMISSAEADSSTMPSSGEMRETIESSHSIIEDAISATEDARLAPKPSGESARLSPKVSSESQRVSTEKMEKAEEDIIEAETTTPLTSREECKVPTEVSKEMLREAPKKSIAVTPSNDAVEVLSKPSDKAAGLSPQASTKSARVTPVPAADTAEMPPKPSGEDIKPKEFTKMLAVPSSEIAKVSPKPSSEVLPTISSKSARTTPTSSSVTADVPPKDSSEEVKVLSKGSSESSKLPLTTSESAKMRPSSSVEKAKISAKTSLEESKLSPKASSDIKKITTEAVRGESELSTEEMLMHKDVSESKIVSSITSTKAQKVSPRTSTEAAKISPEASKKSLTTASLTEAVKVSPKPSTKAAKISPETSKKSLTTASLTEAVKVSPKPSSEAARVSPKVSSKSAIITPTPLTVGELPSRTSGESEKVLPKGSSESTRIQAVPSSEKTQVTPKPSKEVAKLPLKSSTESAKLKPTTSIEKAHVSPKTSTEGTKKTKITPVPSTEAAKLSPKSSSSETVKPSPKASKTTSTTSTDAVAAKLSSDSVTKKMKQESSRKLSSEVLSKEDKLLPKTSIETSNITPTSSVEDAKVASKASEVKTLLPTTSRRFTKVTPKTSTEGAKLTSKSLAEVTPNPSSEAAKLPRSFSVSTKMTSEPSTEQLKLTKKYSSVKTEPTPSESTKIKPKASRAEAKVSPKPSAEGTDISQKASSVSTKTNPKSSKDVIKVSPKPSTEDTDLPSKVSSMSKKMRAKTSEDAVKVSPKPSGEAADVTSRASSLSVQIGQKTSRDVAKASSKPSFEGSADFSPKALGVSSSTSAKVVPSPPSKEKVLRKPSREASKLSTKTSTASTEKLPEASSKSTKVSPKPSGETAILTPKTSSVSSKMAPKPSTEETKLSSKKSSDSTKVASKTSSTVSKVGPTSSTDTAQVSAKQSSKSVKSKKISRGPTKAAPTPSTEVAEKLVSAKPSQSDESSKTKVDEHEDAEVTTKSSAKIIPPTPKDSKASKGESKLSLKRSRESSILSPKVSKEWHKKKAKHHRTEPVKQAATTSSQSTKASPETSSQSSEVISMVIKDSSESSDVSVKSSHGITKDTTKDKMTAKSSGEIVEVTTGRSDEAKVLESTETVSRKPSRKASKSKPSSQSLTKVPSKTESQEAKTSVSASVVSTYVIETPATSVTREDVSGSPSSKSLSKMQTPESSDEHKAASQEKLLEASDSKSRESHSQLRRDGSNEGENRRISLSVPDPVVALKGVGRKTSLPGGAFSEHELERRRLSSTLHDISESRELHEASTSDVGIRQNQDQLSLGNNQRSVLGALGVNDEENRRLSLIHSIPSITVLEPTSPPNDANVLFEEEERERIIYELEHTHPVFSDEHISIAINNRASKTQPGNHGSGKARPSNSITGHLNSPQPSKSSIPDIYSEKVSDVIKVHRPGVDVEGSSQTGSESPKRQSVACIGIQFSPTASREHVLTSRASEVSSKTRLARGSTSKISQELGNAVRAPLSNSFELKGVGLGGKRSSSKALISSRSTEFTRTRSFPTTRGHFSSHSLDTPLSHGVIVTPLKPSPPLSPRLIESSARRSRLKMALSQQRAKETQSETSLTSSKSDPGSPSPKKGSATVLGSGSGSSVNNAIDSKESRKSLPERPSTASGMLKREKIKASRAIISSSSSERSDSAARGVSDGDQAGPASLTS